MSKSPIHLVRFESTGTRDFEALTIILYEYSTLLSSIVEPMQVVIEDIGLIIASSKTSLQIGTAKIQKIGAVGMTELAGVVGAIDTIHHLN